MECFEIYDLTLTKFIVIHKIISYIGKKGVEVICRQKSIFLLDPAQNIKNMKSEWMSDAASGSLLDII